MTGLRSTAPRRRLEQFDLALFPVRPPSRKGESVLGFLVRICAANGHLLPDWVVPQLECSVDASEWPAPWLRLEAAWGSNSWTPPAYRRPKAGTRAKLTWWGPLINRPRICPVCLGLQRMHRTLWEIPLVKLCPEHGIALQTTCTQCDSRLHWHDLASWVCFVCGQPLEVVASQTEAFSPGERHIASALAAALELQVDRFPLPLGAAAPLATHQRGNEQGARPERATYTVEGAMAALAFGLKVREALREVPPRPRIGSFYKSRWKVRRGKVARHQPDWWEARWLNSGDTARERLCRLLLRWTFRYRAGWLVTGKKDDALARVLEALASAPSTAFLAPLRTSLERTLAACEAPVRLGTNQRETIYFNPRLLHSKMTHVMTGLREQWPYIAEEIARAAPVAHPASLVEFFRTMAQPRVHQGTFRRLLRELPLPVELRPNHLCELFTYHGVPRWTASSLEQTCGRRDCTLTHCWLEHHVTTTNPIPVTSYVYPQKTR